MPIDPSADMATFFAADEFGEAITFNGVGGIVGIWDRPTETAELGSSVVVVDTNVMHLPVSQVPDPRGGIVKIVRTGEFFRVVGDPRLNRDDTIHACELEPSDAPADVQAP